MGRPVTRCALSTKTIDGLRTRLELENILDWLDDFRTAVGRVDTEAYALIASPVWQTLLTSQPAIDANKRIAEYVDACLDKDGDNVVVLRSKLRKAHRTDRPGVLFSGMDMLVEIEALVTERSLGEIKITAKEGKKLVFEIGASVAKTRLRAEEIKKAFELLPAAMRATPNALYHTLLDKVPRIEGSQHTALMMQLATYESDLYKAEMIDAPAPWTADELISFLAVDLSRALPAKEVSVIDKKPVALTPSYVCANCKAVGKHLSYDCPIKCATCNFNFCPGARSELCAVIADIPPSKCDLKSGLGKDLIPKLVAKLDEAWKVKHPGKEISSLEVSPIEFDDDSEDGGIGLCHP